MTDVHSHVLSGVDDGASTGEEELRMVLRARSLGVTVLYATPHLSNRETLKRAEKLRERCERLNAAGVEVRLGFEVWGPSLGALPLPDCTLDGRHLLFELPLGERRLEPSLERALRAVGEAGLVPVLAHPERLAAFDTAFLRRALDEGLVLQVDAGSLTGAFGVRVQIAAFEVLESGGNVRIASDAHSVSEYDDFAKVLRLLENREDLASYLAL